MKPTLIIFIPVILLFAYSACKKNDNKLSQKTPVDSIVGTYVGTMHKTGNSTYQYVQTSSIDSTYPATMVVSKVSADSFRTNMFYTITPISYFIEYNIKYDSSNYYSGWTGNGTNALQLFLQLVMYIIVGVLIIPATILRLTKQIIFQAKNK